MHLDKPLRNMDNQRHEFTVFGIRHRFTHWFERFHRWDGNPNWGGTFWLCPGCWQEKWVYGP